MTEKNENKSLTTIDTVKGWIGKNLAHIQEALPRHINVERLTRVCMISIQRNPKLQECSPISLIGAILQCAQLGLEPDDGSGKAYLVPFFNSRKGVSEVQFIAGYKGIIDLARRSGQITIFESRVVRQGDKFEYSYGLNPVLVHIPNSEAWGATPTHFYAVAQFKDGSKQFDVMTKQEVDKIRGRSKAKDSGPWVSDYEEMGKKTVIRRLAKLLPASAELLTAVTLDEKAELGLPQDLGVLADPSATGTPEEEAVSKPTGHDRIINENELKLLCAKSDDLGISEADVKLFIKEKFGKESRKDITVEELTKVLKWLNEVSEPK